MANDSLFFEMWTMKQSGLNCLKLCSQMFLVLDQSCMYVKREDGGSIRVFLSGGVGKREDVWGRGNLETIEAIFNTDALSSNIVNSQHT